MAEPRTSSPTRAGALRGLAPELRLAAAAAAALGFTLILPWYEKSFFATTGRGTVAVTDSLSAFQVFSFVEAAVLLVAAGVLYLVWARAQNKGFHLPGGDGTVIMGAGALGRAAARLAAVRQARRRRPGRDRRDPVGDVRRAAGRRPAGRGGRARARRAPPRAAQPGGRRRRLGAPGAPPSGTRSGARGRRPRSPRRCATGPAGRASRPRRPAAPSAAAAWSSATSRPTTATACSSRHSVA